MGIFIEILAIKNDHVDVFADIAFGDDAVGGGALGAGLDDFAKFWFAESLKSFGKNFFDMSKYAFFESLSPEWTEDCHLCFANSQHG